uniref:OSJNBa0072D21.17 protein n=1 Tax=Oryza sativa subsp. japonica TaxID=39947 RepID=Q7XVC7_ORYSJ|nr:OSJNBa0072D21.17 [Oryza sativa Japonica Group]CAE05285.2 OSJNBa0084N21.3 [Oryza sativa Japonica Group]
MENLRKAFQQVCAAFEPLSDVDGETGDDDKGKNISNVCFMARGESDTEYEDNKMSAFEEAINILSAKNKKCEKIYRKQEFIIESLKSEIARLKSLIPNDDDCENCEVLMNEISKIRDVNAAHDLKNRSSLACSFSLHTRTLDELFLTKRLLQKYKIAFHASLMFNMISAKKLKQPQDVLHCSICNLNKMKLKDALGRVEYMEDVVKNNEVLSCPKCLKSKGVMVDCENCANLEKEVSYLKNSLLRFSDGKKNLNMVDCENCANLEKDVSYLKNSLLRFSDGKKNLNMILDQSKVSTHNRGLGFNPYAHNSRHPPVVLGVGARGGEVLIKPDTNKTVFKSAGIMSTMSASSSKSNVVHTKPPVVACVTKSSNTTNVSNHHEKYTCPFLAKMDILPATERRSDRRYRSGQIGPRSGRPLYLGQTGLGGIFLKILKLILHVDICLLDLLALVARKENVWIVDFGCSRHMTGDKIWFSSLKKASKTESIIFGDAATSTVLATGMVKVNEKFELKNVALVEDLKYNLLSVSQIVDENFEVHFKKTGSKVFDSCGDSVLNISRYGRVFKADFENPVSPVITCLVAKFDKDVMFWHRRLGHVGFDHLTRLSGLDLVCGLPKLKKDLDLVCTPCRHAKMVASSHTPIVFVVMDAPGQLLHMDTVGPARVQSVGGKWYVLVIVDDFSRYSWVFFMATKDGAFQHFCGLFLRLELAFPASLKRIRSDNGGESKNASFEQFCNERGLEHEFSSPRVPQQNGVVERKNRVLVEMARTMLDEYKTPRKFWAKAINTACYISNRVFLRSKLEKTSYELRFGHRPKVSHLRVFGCKCFVLKSGNLDKFEARSTNGLFLGYPAHTRGYRVLILGTNKIVETCEVSFDEASPGTRPDIAGTLSQIQGEDGRIFEDESDNDNDDDEVGSAGQTRRQAGQTAGTPPVRPTQEVRSDRPGSSAEGSIDAVRDGPPEITTSTSTNTERGSTLEVAAPLHIQRRHPPEQIIGNIGERTTRSKVTTHDVCANSAFVASFEPKDVSHALTDESWINAMHEELENFDRNKVWTLVEPPSGHNIIGTKWVFKNKQNEDGLIVRNKARLVAQGFTQVEGLDFDETFVPVARIEAIRLLLAFATSKGFKLYQMDVKSAFLNGFIQEEVYVKQPPGFENPDFPNHVFKLSKALYGFTMGKVDKTLFVLKHGDNQLFVQIYVDDIIFGCSTHALVVDFAETMRREFEMSMMGELSYFLGLQIKQTPQGTFVHQTKYTKDLLKRFKMENYKPISTPIGSTAVLDPDEDGEAVDQKEYRSMIGSLLYLTASRPNIQFVVCLCARFQASPRASHRQAVKRIMRKQSSVAQSTAESEYVAAASCCSQILWLLSTLKDYGLTFEKVHLFCDNTSAINIAKNPVQHSRTKHIDIRFHFLRDHVEKGDVELQFLDTKLQIADIFTKPLDSNRFAFLRGELGIIHPFGMV